jgi:hypothetical protein
MIAFCDVNLSSIMIESGNTTFVVAPDLLLDIVCHKLIRNFSMSSNVIIPSDIEILCSSCFSSCELLSAISFESHSRLTRIELFPFSFSLLQSILIARNVENFSVHHVLHIVHHFHQFHLNHHD